MLLEGRAFHKEAWVSVFPGTDRCFPCTILVYNGTWRARVRLIEQNHNYQVSASWLLDILCKDSLSKYDVCFKELKE